MKGDIQITQIELYKLSIPLKEPFHISLGTIFNADNIIVVIRTRKALLGLANAVLL